MIDYIGLSAYETSRSIHCGRTEQTCLGIANSSASNTPKQPDWRHIARACKIGGDPILRNNLIKVSKLDRLDVIPNKQLGWFCQSYTGSNKKE